MSSGQLRHAGHAADTRVVKTDRLEQTRDIATTPADLYAIGSRERDFIAPNSNEAGERFTSFFKTVGKSIVDEGRRTRVIRINRRQLFDPLRFMERRCFQIAEQDERSVILNEIDASKISLESMLHSEAAISGEEHLKRLKQAGYIRLGASIFQTLWENQHLIPEHWKGILMDRKHIFFDGTVLKNQCGRYVISMYWNKNEEWKWTCCQLDKGYRKDKDVSAVLKVC
jgi:hypothetical protein